MTAVCLPLFFKLVILKIATPFLLVLALNFLPLTLKVSLIPFIPLFLFVFKEMKYFLTLTLSLNVFFLAINFGLAFLTVTFTDLVALA